MNELNLFIRRYSYLGHIQKHKFVFKRQLTELNGQEIYLRKEQQIAGSNQFKKLDDIPYKISVLFDAEF